MQLKLGFAWKRSLYDSLGYAADTLEKYSCLLSYQQSDDNINISFALELLEAELYHLGLSMASSFPLSPFFVLS